MTDFHARRLLTTAHNIRAYSIERDGDRKFVFVQNDGVIRNGRGDQIGQMTAAGGAGTFGNVDGTTTTCEQVDYVHDVARAIRAEDARLAAA